MFQYTVSVITKGVNEVNCRCRHLHRSCKHWRLHNIARMITQYVDMHAHIPYVLIMETVFFFVLMILYYMSNCHRRSRGDCHICIVDWNWQWVHALQTVQNSDVQVTLWEDSCWARRESLVSIPEHQAPPLCHGQIDILGLCPMRHQNLFF